MPQFQKPAIVARCATEARLKRLVPCPVLNIPEEKRVPCFLYVDIPFSICKPGALSLSVYVRDARLLQSQAGCVHSSE